MSSLDQQQTLQPVLPQEANDDGAPSDDSKGWHEGEAAIQTALGVERFDNPALPCLVRGSRSHLLRTPLFALGVTDSQNRIWSTLLGGTAGIARQMSPTIVGINALVTLGHDPAVQTLAQNDRSRRSGSSIQILRKISGVSIDLERRRRLKLFGEVVGLAFTPSPGSALHEMKLIIKIGECVNICSRHINKKRIMSRQPNPTLLSDRLPLCEAAIKLLANADSAFVSSTHRGIDMNTSYRGGPPGFIHIQSNDTERCTLIYAEYAGNNFFSTLGNLKTTPSLGLVVPDFSSGDVLYLSGSASVVFGAEASQVTKDSDALAAIVVEVHHYRMVASGLPLFAEAGEISSDHGGGIAGKEP